MTAWTLLLLTFAYPALRAACLAVARNALASRGRLAVFAVVLFALPLGLIAV